MSTPVDDLIRAMTIIKNARLVKTVICPTQEIADMAEGQISKFQMEDIFTVVVNPYMPKNKIFVIPLPDDSIILPPYREESPDMGLTKHGEGSVLPEDEGQKTAQQGGLSAEAAQELAQENEEADGAVDQGAAD